MQHPPQPAIWSIAKNLSRGMKCKDLVSGQARRKKPMGLNGDLRVIRVASRRRERKEAGLLGPTKSRLGLNLALLGLKLGRTGAHLGQTWASLEPNSGQLAPTWAQLEHDWGLTWRNLGTFGRKLPPKRPNLAQLGPSCIILVGSKWSPSWRQLVMLGWSWAQSTPDGPQITSKVAQLGPGTLWRQLRTKLGPTQTQHGNQWKRAFWGCRIGPATSSILKPYGPQLGPKLLPNGFKLGPSCAISEPSWAEVGAKWVQVGPKLGPCWPKLTPSRANVADMLDRNFGRFWADLRNVQITTVPYIFWRLARANVAPTRSLSCTGLTDLSVASTPITPQHLWCGRI